MLLLIVAMIDHRLYMRLMCRYLNWSGVRVEGRPRYVSARAHIDWTDASLLSLGADVVISSDVRILTHDFSAAAIDRALGIRGVDERNKVRPVSIGPNSFVGARSILLPGVELGRDVVVGAGSVVRGLVADGSIVVGNPAKVVGSVYDKAVA